jgi:hypothetical protein
VVIPVLFAICIEIPGSGRVWSTRQAVESILGVNNRSSIGGVEKTLFLV